MTQNLWMILSQFSQEISKSGEQFHSPDQFSMLFLQRFLPIQTRLIRRKL